MNVKSYYDKISENYENLAISDSYFAFFKLPKLGLKYFNKEKAKVLDLGCGTGLGSLEFFKKILMLLELIFLIKCLKKQKDFLMKN